MARIIRVFPRRTSMTPTDNYAFVGDPPLFRPEAEIVYVSVAFTWDIPKGRHLAAAWGQYYPCVFIGGPAFGLQEDYFESGRYLKAGVSITSRGCNNQCPWCLVPEREGKLRMLNDITPGYIIQDNNLLQCDRSHIAKVLQMLSSQRKAAEFSGGLDATLVTDGFVEALRSIRIKQLFLACDTDAHLKPLEKAVKKLKFLGRHKLRCYVLLAYNSENMCQANERLLRVWEIGCMPFAQLYQPPDRLIKYSQEWRQFARFWSRPAVMKAILPSGR